MENTQKKQGICALTGEQGKFVKSHIIPKALTLLSGTGAQRVESKIGHRAKKSFNSWFDSELVIRKGEDILSDLDTYAINELREHRLVWSGWGDDLALKEEEFTIFHADLNMREVIFEDPIKIRTFFLSLLWRAAASNLKEMADVNLDELEVEDLRKRLVSKDPGSAKDYPICLDQITSLGFPHNRTPFIEGADIPDDAFHEPVRYARFYFDGLVAKIYLASKNNPNDTFMKLSIGGLEGNKTLIFGRNFEKSRSFENIKEMVEDYEKSKTENFNSNISHTRRHDK